LLGFLETPFKQVGLYEMYVSSRAPFDTHQGVKGREFDRVMVIMDDAEARGFMFGYEKLFGVKEPSATDIKNVREGKETGKDRTRRLFYVTCSRAKKSLSLVAYTENPAAVKAHVLKLGWFEENEIDYKS
jgi:DNA helicase-2/ATP-dependent DNA helicase PcrA